MHEVVDVAKRYGASIRRDLQHLQVRVSPTLGEGAMAANPAGGRLGTEQEPSDGHGRRELPDMRESGDEIRVPEPTLLDASLHKVEGPAMPDDVWWASA